MFEGCPGGQPFFGLWGVWAAGVAGSHLRSERRSMTAGVAWRAVANDEISFYRLKARKKAGSHLRSVWQSMTARVI